MLIGFKRTQPSMAVKAIDVVTDATNLAMRIILGFGLVLHSRALGMLIKTTVPSQNTKTALNTHLVEITDNTAFFIWGILVSVSRTFVSLSYIIQRLN